MSPVFCRPFTIPQAADSAGQHFNHFRPAVSPDADSRKCPRPAVNRTPAPVNTPRTAGCPSFRVRSHHQPNTGRHSTAMLRSMRRISPVFRRLFTIPQPADSIRPSPAIRHRPRRHPTGRQPDRQPDRRPDRVPDGRFDPSGPSLFRRIPAAGPHLRQPPTIRKGPPRPERPFYLYVLRSDYLMITARLAF